jgi:hypothetical protein
MISHHQQVNYLNQQVTKLKLQNDQLRQELKESITELQQQDIEQSKHVKCFIVTSFSDEYRVLVDALKIVLEDYPFGWEVIGADKWRLSNIISTNVRQLISQANCYIVELSDNNPNVLLELGAISHYEIALSLSCVVKILRIQFLLIW